MWLFLSQSGAVVIARWWLLLVEGWLAPVRSFVCSLSYTTVLRFCGGMLRLSMRSYSLRAERPFLNNGGARGMEGQWFKGWDVSRRSPGLMQGFSASTATSSSSPRDITAVAADFLKRTESHAEGRSSIILANNQKARPFCWLQSRERPDNPVEVRIMSSTKVYPEHLSSPNSIEQLLNRGSSK